MTDENKPKIENLEQQPEEELTPEQAEEAQGGGLGLLLPAVQKVREAAASPRIADVTDGTSNTLMVGE